MNETDTIVAPPRDHKVRSVALVGNPNSGKSSLFNQLTGLRQKIGNYPGITVDKKTGFFKNKEGHKMKVTDLPGTYSLYPKSEDERVVLDILLNKENPEYPDTVVVILDESNLKRNLLLFSQIKDLGIPVIAALNMVDVANRRGINVDDKKLSEELSCPVIPVNARTGKGLSELRDALEHPGIPENKGFLDLEDFMPAELQMVSDKLGLENEYKALVLLNQAETVGFIDDSERDYLRQIRDKINFGILGFQNKEIITRYKSINQILSRTLLKDPSSEHKTYTERIDKIITHPILGYIIFIGILFLIFQTIFSWAEAPMDWIDQGFSRLAFWVKNSFPEGVFVDMIAEGIIPGLGGIAIFIPQIALLFGFIAILEDTGYMARVVFLMDKIMRKFGLSGKSVVPMVSGVACAIPAVMATRNIENWKERIITIMITPLMTCSARLPVYVILISLVVPNTSVLGFFNLQGLTLLAFYLIGFVAAILTSIVFNKLIKTNKVSFLVMELPTYKSPRWKNVFYTMYEKSSAFVFQAGKIILAISLILWLLASYGPSDKMSNAEVTVAENLEGTEYTDKEFQNAVSTYKLENSYVAMLGKSIEPAIRPLGFDWKIGIALITSFAAREVFVSTIATIYSVGGDVEDETTIKMKMLAEKDPETGLPVYTPAVAFSLLIFYAFAMQCMSTLAIVKRETKGWKWPTIQFFYMSIMAYISSLIVYQFIIHFIN